MTALILLLLTFQQSASTNDFSQTYTASALTLSVQMPRPTSLTIMGDGYKPKMVIHNIGPVLIEIFTEDGKKLVINTDGSVTGDAAHDKAADDFWKNLARVTPICHEEEKPKP